MGFMDLFRPKWKHSAPEVREKAVEGLENQATLADISKIDSDEKVRLAAVKKIEDQTVLAYIAQGDSDDFVRRAAVEKVKDQALLADLAKNDSDDFVRRNAVKKVKDQALLADLAKNASDDFVRRNAVEKVKDQALLADLAKNDSDDFVRRNAVKKVKDQALLADLAKDDSDGDVRMAAASKVDDEALLTDIAKNASDGLVRKDALKEVHDQEVLADIAKNDSDSDVRRVAVQKVEDQAILADIAKNASDGFVRKAGIQKITVQTNLIDIAMSSSNVYDRIVAVHKIFDQGFLAAIAKDNSESVVRIAAVERVGNQSYLDDISKNASDPVIRKMADSPRRKQVHDQDYSKHVFSETAKNFLSSSHSEERGRLAAILRRTSGPEKALGWAGERSSGEPHIYGGANTFEAERRRQFGDMCPDDALWALLQMSFRPEPFNRWAAIRALGMVPCLESAERALEAINDEDGGVRIAAFDALYDLRAIVGFGVLGPIADRLRKDLSQYPCEQWSFSMLERLVKAISDLRDSRAYSCLIELLNLESGVNEAAAIGLGNLGETRAVPYLIELIKNSTTIYRFHCLTWELTFVEALGELECKEATLGLLEILETYRTRFLYSDKGEEEWAGKMRAAILTSLGRFGNSTAVDKVILDLLHVDNQEVVRQAAVGAIQRRCGSEAVKHLVSAFGARGGEVDDTQVSIVEALGKIGDEQSIQALAKMLEKDAPWDMSSRNKMKIAATLSKSKHPLSRVGRAMLEDLDQVNREKHCNHSWTQSESETHQLDDGEVVWIYYCSKCGARKSG